MKKYTDISLLNKSIYSFLLFTGLFLMMPLFSLHVHADCQTTLLIGHRGFSSKYPENTIRAFKGAYANGFQGIEFDVYQSETGQILVHHDCNIKRMTGIKKKIWKVTPKQRYKYLIRKKYKIPTLQETFKMTAGRSGPILIHLKDKPEKGYTASMKTVKKIARLARKYKVKERVIVFAPQMTIERFAGKYGLTYGVSTGEATYEGLKTLVDWSAQNHIKMIMMIHMDQIADQSDEKIGMIHDMGMSAGMYYVNNEDEMTELNRLQVEYGMSDYKLY